MPTILRGKYDQILHSEGSITTPKRVSNLSSHHCDRATQLLLKNSQRRRAVGGCNITSDSTGTRFKSQTFRSRDKSATARPTGWSQYAHIEEMVLKAVEE